MKNRSIVSRVFPAPHAFSLVELLVTIAIIAVLVGLVAGALGAVKREGTNAGCLASLRNLAVAGVCYGTDYRTLPVEDTLGPVAEFELSASCWLCRADGERAINTQGSSYSYLPWLYMQPEPPRTRTPQPRRALTAYEANPRLPLFRDVRPYHGHRNMCFYDGSARAQVID